MFAIDFNHHSSILTPLKTNRFSRMFNTVKSVWFIVYIEGLQVIISDFFYVSFSEERFCLQ